MKRASSVAALLVLAAACSSTNIKSSDNPEAIYNEASKLIEEGRYIEAQEYISEVKTRFPQSRFAAMSDLKAADMAFKQDNFTEAAASYGVFVELYPNHAQAAYAQYQRALSFYDDAPEKIARDQAPARDAAAAAEQLIKRYPQSEFVEKAHLLYKKARLKLAEKEAYVARFYETRGAHLAARNRWQGLIVSFPELKEVPEAKDLIHEAETKVAEFKE